MPNKLTKYELYHSANIAAIEKQLLQLYDSADFEILAFVRATFRDNPNYVNTPLFQSKLADIQRKLHDNILSSIGTGVQNADLISALKSKDYIASLFRNRKAYEIVVAKEFKTSSGAATQYFTERAKEGFDISARVWDITGQKKAEIADSVAAGIAEGTSGKELAKSIQKYLNEPDKVFRRVRDAEGKLVESQARKDYHPGQGIYKSSEANAFRLSRTEINGAYKSADQQRWQQQDFVTGYRVKLSNNPNHCPFCEAMQGDYPKTFKWFSWHPQCRCSCTPILLSKAEYSKYEDYLLGIGDKPDIQYLQDIPKRASNFIENNAEMINGWSNTPYWVKDNPNFVSELLKK
jgi:hypothetical protein